MRISAAQIWFFGMLALFYSGFALILLGIDFDLPWWLFVWSVLSTYLGLFGMFGTAIVLGHASETHEPAASRRNNPP